MAQDPEQVGKAFLEYYYNLFGSNRAALSSLYQDQSMFTFEGNKCQGAAAITAKLTSLPFNQCKITPGSMDFQPSISGGILVFVTGHVQAEGESNALKFSQVFHLMPVGTSFVVTNDMFRLNYG
ncbi:nuclear transport factor [Raphidocelis subcapitata]|uniref:Nuclear transport factor n=1 Tax=Raphidocelis subcapitata TaxID=307507 RepID=A0A2V0PDT6_9CHLO|nr:nuclear transport factor [Raphidocelis subcapitata]|eukprot:GBF95255.1 nuclear transport factor [Raphidocelis subcapitata]